MSRTESVRWPAEWEPHEATWLAWPHNPETWPGLLTEVEDAFVEMVRALDGRELVRIAVDDGAAAEHVRERLRTGGVDGWDRVELHLIPTDDAWIRDHGPVFVVRTGPQGPTRLAVDFPYDAWGGKYPPYDRDAAVPAAIAQAVGVPRREAPIVLEGGSVDGDGAGTILTTTTCLLHPNRRREGEPPRTCEALERVLADELGARHVIWLEGEIAGDDTDGHVDDLARFASEGVVVTAGPTAGDPNAAMLVRTQAALREARDAAGRRLDLVVLPMPPPIRANGNTCPATYVNFYIANGVVLAPVFGAPEDARALAALGELFPGREVVPIPARALVAGLGAVHCLTQQEPAAPETAGA